MIPQWTDLQRRIIEQQKQTCRRAASSTSFVALLFLFVVLLLLLHPASSFAVMDGVVVVRSRAERLLLASTSSVSSSSSAASQQPKQKHMKRQRSLNKDAIRSQFRYAQRLEQTGQWRESADIFEAILEQHPHDSYSWLALAKLQAKRGNKNARHVFETAHKHCPDNVHILQAWAVYEQQQNNVESARQLFEKARQLDQYNPYVCHAYGLLEKQQNNVTGAEMLWRTPHISTAALVCSLGELLVGQNRLEEAQELYETHVTKLSSKRQQSEVYLAWAWLVERYFCDYGTAKRLLETSLAMNQDSKTQVALARLNGRHQKGGVDARTAEMKNLERFCDVLEMGTAPDDEDNKPEDGRVYNAWANLEVKAHNLQSAQKILQRGLRQFPSDHSLLQAAGKVEERLGNLEAARKYYSHSLSIQPSAPTLVAYALLTMNDRKSRYSFNETKRFFEEALLIDKSHGPAYNAYAKAVSCVEGNETATRSIYERGLAANCTDVASIYHGYAKFELALGNVQRARELLLTGHSKVQQLKIGSDSPHRERAVFLAHTLGMLELNSHRPCDALEVFTQGIASYGSSSRLLLGAALCETRLGNEQRARKLFEQSVQNDHCHAQAWQAWAVMEMKAGNLQTATTLFECGIRKAPQHGALWQAYGVLQSRVGNVDNARRLFRKGLKVAPSHVSLYQSWASLELRENNFDTARSLIAQALTLNKRNGAGWLIASEIEERRTGQRGLSQLLLRRGIECCPTNGSLYRALGESLLRSGQIDAARKIFEQGMELDPTYAPLYHSLAELEARVFNIEGLAKLHKRCQKIFRTNALEQPTDERWGSKLQQRSSEVDTGIPRGVQALADRIVEEDDENGDEASASLRNLLNDDINDELILMMESSVGDGLFGDLMLD